MSILLPDDGCDLAELVHAGLVSPDELTDTQKKQAGLMDGFGDLKAHLGDLGNAAKIEPLAWQPDDTMLTNVLNYLSRVNSRANVARVTRSNSARMNTAIAKGFK